MARGDYVTQEIDSQGDCWRRARQVAKEHSAVLPQPGERVAAVGCGTSWFMAQAFAGLREESGQGETDAFAASEFPLGRTYDRVVVITRSGTTTEVLSLIDRLGRTPITAITAEGDSQVTSHVDSAIVLDFANERSIVQTRFATTALNVLRAHVGDRLDEAIVQLDSALSWTIELDSLQRSCYTFLGSRWTNGLANEAALKMREASLSWAEAFPAMDYRHGPISTAGKHSLIWFLGSGQSRNLPAQVAELGAHVVADQMDPVVDLVRVQRLAVAAGLAKGIDPDRPPNLTRSVILR